MSRTYKATGINLKSMPMGEADRLLTILTREFGLVRAVAPGARKHNSRMAGRSEPFVVNELLIAKGRSLDKVTQAETLESYPGLAQNLPKLIASQYLAELALYQALSDQPQEELFYLLNEHLGRIERSSSDQTLARLTHAVFQLLVLAGLAPQVHLCGVTRQEIQPDLSDPDWRCGFSIPLGGIVTQAALEQLIGQNRPVLKPKSASSPGSANFPADRGLKPTSTKLTAVTSSPRRSGPTGYGNLRLAAAEVFILQRLAESELPTDLFQKNLERIWHSVERVLRQYAEYHLDHVVRSAGLIDTCFNPADPSLPV